MVSEMCIRHWISSHGTKGWTAIPICPLACSLLSSIWPFHELDPTEHAFVKVGAFLTPFMFVYN